MKGLLKTLLRPFHSHCKACVINESDDEIKHAMEVVRRFDMDADGFTDYKKVLYQLHTSKRYSIIIIHENGSKSKPNMLTTFIHQLNPNLPVITYKNEDQLTKQLQAFC